MKTNLLKIKLQTTPTSTPSRASSKITTKELTNPISYDSGLREGAEESRGSLALRHTDGVSKVAGLRFMSGRRSVASFLRRLLNPSSHIANVPRSAVTTPHAWVKSASSARITGHHRTV